MADLDLDQAAEAYARELDDVVFDVCLLGMGPDGHVASIFPEHPSSYAEGEVIPYEHRRSRLRSGSV
jgi:6-phosphogluconolactonase